MEGAEVSEYGGVMGAVAESIRCEVRPSTDGRLRVEVSSVYLCDRPEDVRELVEELARHGASPRVEGPSHPDTNRRPI